MDREREGVYITKTVQFYLSYLLDLSPALPDERTTLRALDDQTK